MQTISNHFGKEPDNLSSGTDHIQRLIIGKLLGYF